MILNREIIDNLHADIEQWYSDYLDNEKQYGISDEQNEWYSQLIEVLLAAYGAD